MENHHNTPMRVRATAALVRGSRNSNPVDHCPSVSEQSNRYSKVRVPLDIYNNDILVAMSIHRRDPCLQENLSGDRPRVLGGPTFAGDLKQHSTLLYTNA